MNEYNTKALYFTTEIKNKLKGIANYNLTIVTAPMGYGKTTAVKKYLYNNSMKVLWNAIYDGSVFDFWIGFCECIENIDKEIADSLEQIGFPTDATRKREMLKLMRKINFPADTVFVIDDYHLVTSKEVDEFISFFVCNIPQNLHLVVISRRTFLSNKNELMLKGLINNITVENFAFKPEDIAKYYELCGFKIDGEEVNKLYNYSEGWISALYLYMLEYTEKREVIKVNNMELLVNETVYAPLSTEIKGFLFFVCIFDVFTIGQATFMFGESKQVEENLSMLMDNNAFLQYDNLTKKYSFHKIFSNFINDLFENKSDEFKKSVWKKAGLWYRDNEKYMNAEEYFYKSREFKLLIATIEIDRGRSITKEHKLNIINYMTDCPKDIKSKHHLAMLIYILNLFTFNEMELFKETYMEVNENIYNDTDLTSEERDNFLSEYELILSFSQYNDIENMSIHHKKACELMRRTSVILSPEDSWTFGSPSVLYMFYRESGKLSEQLEIMKNAMPYYNKLTNNHGNAAECVMEAEILFNRFDFKNAEISLYKAIIKLNNEMKSGLMLCLIFLKIRMAIFKGDYLYIKTQLEQVRKEIIDKKLYIFIHTLDLCEAYIYSLLDQPQLIPDWIVQGDFDNTNMMFPAVPALNMIYGNTLLVQKEYTKLISMEEYFTGIASIFPNIICHIYINIHLAVAYSKNIDNNKALLHLKKALDIAMPDKIYIPFVENVCYIYDLVDKLVCDEPYKDYLLNILDMSKKYLEGKNKIIKENFSKNQFGLTEKEIETVELVAKGLTNREIAGQLFISENTVKLRLKNIFGKLNIKSRAELRK